MTKLTVKRLHGKVRQEITRRVTEHEYGMGERLPSVCKLANSFGVSVITVARALRDLRSTGVVDCVPGLGSFVRQRRRFVFDLDVLLRTSETPSQHFFERQIKIISVTREKLSSFDFSEFDAPIETMCCVRSLISIDAMPIMFDTVYLSLCLGDNIVSELNGRSIGEFLRDREISFDNVRLFIDARTASNDAKAAFAIPEAFPTLRRVYQLITEHPLDSVFGISESPFDRLAWRVDGVPQI
ncbi:GntR family transcriptional regulator [Paraburkholderia caribensis]|uniref:Transcriptional regulator, GntR family n=2 Tax=Paraburkholderia TaxID=1822464 RepID=B2JXS1_PARP8|nr:MULTISPECIES: GntR family transcriptional regulator [Paraburkholderia]ACC76429.1 transcriptional regulator, GntR family [Paraburkholderia phymatum STM815]MCO4879407.1 GntR family transcriptional regulator [Paraburkholderia caribensis]PTB23248.1 GntR family transcriptional regulator [Paraburkholderia caribensis]